MKRHQRCLYCRRKDVRKWRFCHHCGRQYVWQRRPQSPTYNGDRLQAEIEKLRTMLAAKDGG